MTFSGLVKELEGQFDRAVTDVWRRKLGLDLSDAVSRETYNDFDIGVTHLRSLSSTNAVATVPCRAVWITPC